MKTNMLFAASLALAVALPACALDSQDGEDVDDVSLAARGGKRGKPGKGSGGSGGRVATGGQDAGGGSAAGGGSDAGGSPATAELDFSECHDYVKIEGELYRCFASGCGYPGFDAYHISCEATGLPVDGVPDRTYLDWKHPVTSLADANFLELPGWHEVSGTTLGTCKWWYEDEIWECRN